jgi:hypothetical protein
VLLIRLVGINEAYQTDCEAEDDAEQEAYILTKVAFLVRQRDEGNDSHEYNGETGLQYVLARYESGAKGQRRLTERKT